MTKTIDQIIQDAKDGITSDDLKKPGTYTLTNLEAAIVAAALSAILAIHHGQYEEGEITINLLANQTSHNTIADVLGRIVEQQAPASMKAGLAEIKAGDSKYAH